MWLSFCCSHLLQDSMTTLLHLDLYLIMILLSRLISTSISKRLESAICSTFIGYSRFCVVVEAFEVANCKDGRKVAKLSGTAALKNHLERPLCTLYSFKRHTNNFIKCNDASNGTDFDRGYQQTLVKVFLIFHTHMVEDYRSGLESPVATRRNWNKKLLRVSQSPGILTQYCCR